ncbi:hypothetical protein Tco_0515588, partial [Tanacetum coccineum]
MVEEIVVVLEVVLLLIHEMMRELVQGELELELKRVMQDQLGHGKENARCHLLIGCNLVVSLANWMQFG